MTAMTFSQLVDSAGGAATAASWNAFLATPTGQSMLQQIEQKAQSGVEQAAKKNAINLMLFALAGGAIGGTVFKGPLGIAAAIGLAVWAGSQILADPTGEQQAAP